MWQQALPDLLPVMMVTWETSSHRGGGRRWRRDTQVGASVTVSPNTSKTPSNQEKTEKIVPAVEGDAVLSEHSNQGRDR